VRSAHKNSGPRLGRRVFHRPGGPKHHRPARARRRDPEGRPRCGLRRGPARYPHPRLFHRRQRLYHSRQPDCAQQSLIPWPSSVPRPLPVLPGDGARWACASSIAWPSTIAQIEPDKRNLNSSSSALRSCSDMVLVSVKFDACLPAKAARRFGGSSTDRKTNWIRTINRRR